MNELQDLEQRISMLQDEKDKIQKVRIAKMQQVSQYTKIYQSRQDQITARERQLKDVSEKMTLAEEAEELSKRAQCEKEVRI
jgi:biopolymer transport protein ExbB/TolQ